MIKVLDEINDVGKQIDILVNSQYDDGISLSSLSPLMNKACELIRLVSDSPTDGNPILSNVLRTQADIFRKKILNLAAFTNYSLGKSELDLRKPLVAEEDGIFRGLVSREQTSIINAFVHHSPVFKSETESIQSAFSNHYKNSERAAISVTTKRRESTTTKGRRKQRVTPGYCRKMPVMLQPFYIHALFQKTKFGSDSSVIKYINNTLANYRNNCMDVEKAKERQKTVELESVSRPQADQKKSTFDDGTLQPLHATPMGAFDICTFYLGTGFNSTQFLSRPIDVGSQHSIVGSIPTFKSGNPLLNLKQDNPQEFLSAFDQIDIDENDSPLTEGAKKALELPIIAVCQLHISSLLDASLGFRVLPVLLRSVDKKIEDVINNNRREWGELCGLEGLVAVSLNWSSITVFIRSHDMRCLTQAINKVNSLQIRDLSSHFRSDDYGDDFEQLRKAFESRFTNIVSSLSRGDSSADKVQPQPIDQLSNHMFSDSHTTINILYPFYRNAIDYENLRFETKEVSHQFSSKKICQNYHRWQVTGAIRTHTTFDTRCGHFGQMVKKLAPLCRSGVDKAVYSFGSFDFSLEDDDFCERGREIIPPKKYLKNLDYNKHQARAVLGKIFQAKEVLDQHFSQNKDRNDELLSLVEMATTIGGVYVACMGKNSTHLPLALQYEKAVTSFLSNYKFSNAKQLDDIARGLRNKNIPCHYIDEFFRVSAMWVNALRNLKYASSMVDLSGAWTTAVSLLESQLEDENTTTDDILSFLTSFGRPFRRAIVQRTMPDYCFDGATDILMDHEGALQKVLSSIDGLLKGIMALIGKPDKVASLTLVTDKPNIRIDIYSSPKRVFDKYSANYLSEENSNQTLFGVLNINFRLLEEPSRIHVVFHEMVHLIVTSSGFIQALHFYGKPGVELERLMNASYETRYEGNQLWSERITEMIIEYQIAWLLYRDNPITYSKVYVLQLSMDIEMNTRKPELNDTMLVEMLSRCFLVYILVSVKEEDFLETAINFSEVFGGYHEVDKWWFQIRHFINRYEHADRDAAWEKCLYDQVILYIRKLLSEKGSLQYIQLIPKVWRQYFLGSENSIRYGFYHALRDSFSDYTMTDLISKEAGKAEIYDFIHESEDQSKSDRFRRLEPLIGYCLIIRNFYDNQIAQLEEEDGNLLFVRRRTEEGRESILFDDMPSSSVVVNQREGSLFWIGGQARKDCTSLRLSFQSSLMHLSELSRYAEFLRLFD